VTITLRLSGINLFVSQIEMTEHSDEITHPGEFRSRWPIFPNPSFGPGALLIHHVCITESTRIIYIAACAFLPRINIFRRSFLVRGETRRRQVQIYRRTFPERAYPSDPAALITFHEISTNSSCSFLSFTRPLMTARTPRRRDRVTDVYPSRGDPDGYAGFDGNKRMLV